jgi:ribonuclease HI
MNDDNQLSIYSDGASRGNPGPAAAAFIILQNDKILYEESFFLGVRTNNQAEYQAVINALRKVKEFTNGHIIVHSDSELVIKQLNGDYRVNDPQLKALCVGVFEERGKFTDVKFIHVLRQNSWIKHVDKLCNQNLNKNS